MAYKFLSRLRHASDRFGEVNTEPIIYIRGTIQRPMQASFILISADEMADGDPTATRVERQDVAIDVSELADLYPPLPNDYLLRQCSQEKFKLVSMGRDEPPYVHVTSNRDRVICHLVRVKGAKQ